MEELDFVVDTLDTVPEAMRALYAEDAGKYRLKVRGLEDTSGLKSALDKERKTARELARKVSKWEALGKSDEEISALLEKATAEETERAKQSGDYESILKQHQEKAAKKEAELQEQLNAALASERKAVISTSLMAALTKAGATEEGIDLLPERLAARIKFEVKDGERRISIMAGDGVTPLAGSGSDGLATFDDLVKEITAKFPSLFKGSGQSGSGMRPINGAGGPGVKRKSDLKTERDRAKFVDEHGLDTYKALAD